MNQTASSRRWNCCALRATTPKVASGKAALEKLTALHSVCRFCSRREKAIGMEAKLSSLRKFCKIFRPSPSLSMMSNSTKSGLKPADFEQIAEVINRRTASRLDAA